MNGILEKPQKMWPSTVAFCGPDGKTLYATCGDKVFKRSAKVKGIQTFASPIKPRGAGIVRLDRRKRR